MKLAGKSLRHQKGNLMLIAVIILVILGTFSAVAIRTLTSNSISSSISMGGLQAFYLAESGQEYGALDIKNNIDLYNPTIFCNGAWKTTQTFGSGEFRYSCSQYTPSGITTTAAVTAAAMVIPISSTAGVAPLGRITIESEQVDYGNISTSASVCGAAPCLVVKKRGANSTIAATHNPGSSISQAQLVVQSEGDVPSVTNPQQRKVLQKAVQIILSAQYVNAWAVGEDGAIYRRPVLGQWTRFAAVPVIPNGSFTNFYGVSCSDATHCWVVGSTPVGMNPNIVQGVSYQWNGAVWTLNSTTFSANRLISVACPDDNLCWAIDNSRNMYRWNGATWAFYTQLSTIVDKVTCYDASMCVVVGQSGFISRWNGSSWTTVTPAVTALELRGVACPSTTHCFAVGDQGIILEMINNTWAVQVAASGSADTTLVTVSCGDTNHCWAFGMNKYRNAWYQNGTWVPDVASANLDNKLTYEVYCILANYCFLVSEKADASNAHVGIFNGAIWTQDTITSESNTAEDLFAVSSDASTIQFPTITAIGWREVFN